MDNKTENLFGVPSMEYAHGKSAVHKYTVLEETDELYRLDDGIVPKRTMSSHGWLFFKSSEQAMKQLIFTIETKMHQAREDAKSLERLLSRLRTECMHPDTIEIDAHTGYPSGLFCTICRRYINEEANE